MNSTHSELIQNIKRLIAKIKSQDEAPSAGMSNSWPRREQTEKFKKPIRIPKDAATRELAESYHHINSVDDLAAALEQDGVEHDEISPGLSKVRDRLYAHAEKHADAEDKMDGVHWEDWPREELTRLYPYRELAEHLMPVIQEHRNRKPKT